MCTDEFNLAVNAWNGGAVDNFSASSNANWTYSFTNACDGGGLNGVQLPRSEVAENLLSEDTEREQFGSYPRVTYHKDTPNTVQARAGCNFNFAVLHNGDTVRHSSWHWLLTVSKLAFSNRLHMT